MNIQRFTARTSREALSKARLAFGEGTLILSNRPTETGVEVVATGEDTLAALDRGESLHTSNQTTPATAKTMRSTVNPNSPVLDDATQLAMSTLSFQDYVRERMLRRRHEALSGLNGTPGGSGSKATLASGVSQPSSDKPTMQMPRGQGLVGQTLQGVPTSGMTGAQNNYVNSVHSASHASAATRPSSQPARHAPLPSVTPAPAVSQGIVDELQSVKALIEERFNTLTWLGQGRQNPTLANLMLKLIQSGYSPTLARTILEHMPEGMEAAAASQWVKDVLVRNLKTDAGSPAMHEEGGIYALIGSTGVGKTTTAAKMAGLCARVYGANSVGLITLDTYRVGAHEQLRAYGRMMGIVAHLAHDKAALQDLLGLLSNKKMVLIDTTGIAPSDPRKRDMQDVLNLPDVNRLLVLNAGGHGDTLDDVVSSFKTGMHQQAILSKLDEAAKIGPALDAAIRHQLLLRGVTMGQKVPEDWERADGSRLVASSMQVQNKSAFDPKASDISFFFVQQPPVSSGHLHA